MNLIRFRIWKVICSIAMSGICSFGFAQDMLFSLADEYRYEVEHEVSYDNVYTVTLKNQSGNIEFEAYDEELISVKMTKRINASNEQVARDFAKMIELVLEKSNDTLSIEATLPEKRSAANLICLDYKIRSPRDLALKIQNENGNVVIKEISGVQEVEVVNGDVELVGTAGKFSVKVDSGNISGAILLNDETEFYTNNGNISIDLLDTLFFPTSAETDNGSVTFRLPTGLSAVLKANAPNGVVSCDLPASVTRKSDSSIECVINDGGPLLRIKSANGDINVNEWRRGEGAKEPSKAGYPASSGEGAKEQSKAGYPASSGEGAKEQNETRDTKHASRNTYDAMPLLDFNRVQGLVLGGATQVSTVKAGGGRVYGSLEYGLANEIWNYRFGAEKSWFDKHKIAIGFELHKITDTNDADLLSEGENFLSTFLFGDAFSDYFLRDGYCSWLSLKLTPSTKMRVQYNNDEYSSLFKMTDWCLLYPEQPKPFNRRIDDGILKSITFSYLFDSRDVKEHRKDSDFTLYPVPCLATKNGWLGELSLEYARNNLGGDFDYLLYHFKISRYNRISDAHAIDIRVQGGISTERLPIQKQFYIGGIGTLRGYDFKEFAGDNMLLANFEYSLKLSPHFWASLFYDSGYAWFYDQETELIETIILPIETIILPDDFHSSAGFGIKIAHEDQTVILYLAQPLENERGPGVILRIDRMF